MNNIPRDFVGPRIKQGRYVNSSTKNTLINSRITGLRNTNLPNGKKFNPDVNKMYGKIDDIRNQQKRNYKLGYGDDSRYKTIINDKPLPKLNRIGKIDSKYLSINVKHNKDQKEINNNLRNMQNERNYTDKEKEKYYSKEKEDEFKRRFKFRNIDVFKEKLKNFEATDFEDMKSDVLDYYKDKQNKLDKHKQKINDIVDYISKQNYNK